MGRKRNKVAACLLVLVLLATLYSGCRQLKAEELTIRIGCVTDITGQGAPVLIHFIYILDDLVRYYNQEDPIPGVKIELDIYDTRSDAARDLPAYEWMRDWGADIIIVCMPQSAEAMMSFAERDEIPLAVIPATEALVQPPAWAYCFSYPAAYAMRALLEWISENHWDYDEGIPKVGCASWRESYSVDVEEGVREYCRAYPEKFDYVAGLLPPQGTVAWGGEVEKLKECDYVAIPNIPPAMGTFAREFRAKGNDATFIGPDAVAASRDFLVKMCGWEAVDGTLSTNVTGLWTDDTEPVRLAKEILYKYRPDYAEEIMSTGGTGYLGGFQSLHVFFELLRNAITAVGAENFDGQAFCAEAVTFKTAWEDCPEWGFTATRRYALAHTAIYEFREQLGDLVRMSDWLPVIGP
ncbi:ABC transporter substrate-binding protein [Chloroflexota bacterium]